MATSFVQLGEHGFWCRDGLLEVLAALLAETLALRFGAAWPAYVEHLKTQATAGMTGCIDLGLDGLPAAAQVELLDGLALLRDRIERGLADASAIERDDLVRLVDVLERLLTREWPWSVGDAEALPRAWLLG